MSGVSCAALTALLIGPLSAQAQEAAEATDSEKRLKPITVTATKLSESAQDIPVAVQAVDSTTLDQLNIGNFDDYLKHLPSVSAGGRGPGQNTVYIRGMAVQPITVLVGGAQGTMPNVALYVDEQPVTAPGRNLDVYAVDMERIEVLPGPQGTLFGASSQAGTIRLITNKPNFDSVAYGFDIESSFTKDGDMSQGAEGYINVPIIEDKLAVRAAMYSIQKGGYIDNTYGTFTTDPSINTLSTATPNAVSYETADNALLVEENFNSSSYQGMRVGVRYQPHTDWNFLVQYARQALEADGVFDFDPEVGDLEVNRFFPDELEDEFEQLSWTAEGRLAMLDVVYTGAFLSRDVQQSVDYTGYNNSGAFVDYYTCTYANPAYIVNYGIDPTVITPGGRECLTPVKGAIIDQRHNRDTHELRFSTPQENRWRVTAGAFYDNYELKTQDDFYYLATADLGFAPNAPISTAYQVNPNTRPPGVAFFNDILRSEEQIAFFGEGSFDIVPDMLTATIGLRSYEIESDFKGSSNFADGIFQGSQNTDRGRDYDVSGGHTTEPLTTDGVVKKFNLSYTPFQDVMFYATYSEGFRPGGWNRGGGIPSVNPAFPDVSATYDTDDVKNYEFGWKSLLLDGTLQFNGNIYFVEWTDMQVSRFDPQNVSILTFIENSADSEVMGIEGDVVWGATDNLTLFGAFSYNDTELTAVSAQIVELAPVGSSLPLSPELQIAARARYEWVMGEFDAYAQGGFQYASESYSSLVAAERLEQSGYTMADIAIGAGRDSWNAELFVTNLTDERPEYFLNSQDDILRTTTARPRTFGVRVSYDY
ncbi:MAG: TonB-dependent receptor [Hirschia sp.]|nr:TonB-dependent receptor [Hirschia sp.]MBF20171.1 TonB-dependent receptor [Hirschia sp.]